MIPMILRRGHEGLLELCPISQFAAHKGRRYKELVLRLIAESFLQPALAE